LSVTPSKLKDLQKANLTKNKSGEKRGKAGKIERFIFVKCGTFWIFTPSQNFVR
jgi:hypothetical protein